MRGNGHIFAKLLRARGQSQLEAQGCGWCDPVSQECWPPVLRGGWRFTAVSGHATGHSSSPVEEQWGGRQPSWPFRDAGGVEFFCPHTRSWRWNKMSSTVNKWSLMNNPLANTFLCLGRPILIYVVKSYCSLYKLIIWLILNNVYYYYSIQCQCISLNATHWPFRFSFLISLQQYNILPLIHQALDNFISSFYRNDF